ncbi:SdpI family protein [Micromonospora sp. NPDC023956]|uniref:SdpI family protein n=1 Tax=Micromonospora sp. NPDC023956 TaxID=3155722 RepID=UPI0033FABDE9
MVGLITALLGLLAVPLVCVGVTRAGANGQLERNGAVGIRTRDTQLSDAAWQAGHAAVLPVVTRTGWVGVVAAVLAVATHVAAGLPWSVLVAVAGLTAESVLLAVAAGAAGRAARDTARPG